MNREEREHEYQKQFDRDGFTVWKGLFESPELLKAAQEAVEEIRTGEYATGEFPQGPQFWWPLSSKEQLCKIEMPHRSHSALERLIHHPALAHAMETITQASLVQLFWVTVFYKEPFSTEAEVSHRVGWHQDWLYWHNDWEDDSELFSAWIPLTSVDQDSGTLRFLPGSHRWGETGMGNLWKQELHAQLEEIEDARGEALEVVRPEIALGDVSFHRCLTFHGSPANTSSEPRSALVLNLRTQRSTPRGGAYLGMREWLRAEKWNPVLVGKRPSGFQNDPRSLSFRREW
jgi:ectoine hydroxylase-related dioxygenase (phytanoyl-CoA dioxygenase family)